MSNAREPSAAGHLAAVGRGACFIIAALAATAGCTKPAGNPPAAPAIAQQNQDIWEILFLQGAKIGYAHTQSTLVERDEVPLRSIESHNHLELVRFGQRSQQQVTMHWLETPSGELVEFTTKVAMAGVPAVTQGRVVGNQLLLTTEVQGRADVARVPWGPGIGGFRAVEDSLARKPLEAGEKRTLTMLVPLVNQVAEVQLTAGKLESTPVLGTTPELLRIESVARLPDGNSIQTTLWANARGQVVKSRVSALDQESFVTTPEIARAPVGEAQFDLGLDLIVKVEPPIADAHTRPALKYRVELKDGDPAQSFAVGPTQFVRSLDAHSAEITVRKIAPAEFAANPQAPPPGEEFLSANSVLQIDDARIQKMAAEAQGDLTDPRQIALALERYVHRAVTRKNFSQGFASAAEVAQSREGDCTEHAVLLAALLRAVGIPSRVAIGLVYVEHAGGFGYHMWTEAFLDGNWVPLDAMMGAGGATAAYLKLTDSSLAGASAYSSFLAVAQVLGQLKIEVVGE